MFHSSIKSRYVGWQLVACFFVTINLQTDSGGTEPQVDATIHAEVGDGPLHAYVGTVTLPADGLWRIQAPESAYSISELYLMPTQPSRLRQLGKRMYAAMEEKQTQNSRWQIQMGYEACRQFAQEGKGLEGKGVGPKSITELAGDKRWEYVSQRWGGKLWSTGELQNLIDEDPVKGPFVHLIPEVRFQFSQEKDQPKSQPKAAQSTSDPVVRRVVAKKDRAVLAFELRPFVDDGKHWVLFTNGNCERVEFDAELLANQKVTIRPIVGKLRPGGGADRPNLEYKLVLITAKSETRSLELSAQNHVLNQTLPIQWDIEKAANASYSDLRKTINDARRFAWNPYLIAAGGGMLQVWNHAGQDNTPSANPPPANSQRNLSMFSVLGGRAAVEETLQLQDLSATDNGDAKTIDVDSIAGVEVKSHPFAEMLGGQPGGNLELAQFVPPDRFFLHVGKPESMGAMLDSGAPYIASLGTTLTGNCLRYNLEQRYLAKLGMTRDWVDAVLTSGLTSEMALFTPDLFFIDGTDVTVVAKLRQPQLLQQLLGLLGASKLTTESVLEVPTSSGGTAYFALRDNLLFASTHRGELQQSLDLLDQQGEGSLGASTEFRYMLTQLPVNDETRLYAYFSDPFVRRLVGPRVKLGQRRRVLAKAKMEALTARAMLARLDGHAQPDSLSELARSEHLPKEWTSEGFSINPAGIVSSQRYDSLPDMRSLPKVPMEKVTPSEAESYKEYVENYSRFWRRFFDPIAIRLDEVGNDQLELSTFILPLVDNSIYNGLRMVLAHQDDATTLSIPIVQPAPVVQFSANLKDTAWQQIAGNFSEFFTRYSGASSAMLDDFGPSIHVAVFDADPIIAMGSGDVFGAFGGDVLRGGGNQMLMLPIALSMLTRPCSIMVETKSPERTAQYLRQAALAGVNLDRRSRDFGVSFYQVGDRDEWVWTMDIFGVIKLRYGVEVAGKYFVIRNIPWSSDDRVVSVVPSELNAAVLQANPSACKQQLPGLFAAASDANRRSVMGGLGRLYPFMLSGAKSVEEATAQHQRLFGFYPREPDGDQWTWKDYRLISDNYGEPTRQQQPAFDPKQPFGLMNRIDSLQLNMQFEQDGLRSSVRWRLR